MEKPDPRSSSRIRLRIPVILEGEDVDGAPIREETLTENVSITGARFAVSRMIPPGSVLVVASAKAPQKARALARVIWSHEVHGGLKAGVRFVDPDQNWILK
jgi:hypothetical protein